MADEMGVAFLGDIELDPRLGQSCDSGKSFVNDMPDSRVSRAYKKIIGSRYSDISSILFTVCLLI